VLHGVPRGPPLASALLGPRHAPDAIERLLADVRVPHRRFESAAARDAAIAARLEAGEVGGVLQGRLEWGPRALGARSILADPRRASMKERVNRSVKYREGFRPFAPAVLADEAGRWFEELAPIRHLAPFMTGVARVTAEGRAALPAVTHVDGTARVQVVDRAASPDLAGILEAFRDRTGVGVLLNTSLNLKDEPLVATPAEALGVLVRSELDFLVLERCVVERAALPRRAA
jgi:carbamoyltransferase